jgi:putative ATP-binding cassette transporter
MSRVIFALRTFLHLALPYFRSEDRLKGSLLLAGVIGAELGLVFVAVAVINWNARFFNALEEKSWNSLAPELVILCFLVVGAVIVGMAQYYFGQTLTIRWRQWMTERYVGMWMADGRHYRINFVDQSIDNIHLRIANDVFLFIQRTHELGTGLLGSVVALASFAYVLWGVSAITPLPLFGVDLSFPGYLIWIALAYAATGTLIAHLIGRPLIALNFNQQRFESDFRFAIARVTDYAEPVALMGGEAVERQELRRRFATLVENWTNLVRRQTRLTGFIAGYGHISTAFPILTGTPAFLAGAIPLGVLMQGALAFQRVEGAFAFCLSSYSKIAEWKAIMDRLSQFEAAMAAVDEQRSALGTIDFATASDGDLCIRDLALRVSPHEAIATVPALSVGPGERLLITGRSGSGKSCLLRAIAGIWPLGDGAVRLPRGARILALPQRRYFPLGTLRQALAYPTPAHAITDEDIRAALDAAGIGALAARLDERAEWSTVLSGGEQERIGFARVLLHRPDVVLLDEAVSTLEEAEARELYLMLAERLPSAIVVSVGRSALLAGLHRRIFEIGAFGPPVRAQRRTEFAAAAT